MPGDHQKRIVADLNKDLVERAEELAEKRYNGNRSEVLRQSLREFLDFGKA